VLLITLIHVISTYNVLIFSCSFNISKKTNNYLVMKKQTTNPKHYAFFQIEKSEFVNYHYKIYRVKKKR
jgi:hypothetical protein